MRLLYFCRLSLIVFRNSCIPLTLSYRTRCSENLDLKIKPKNPVHCCVSKVSTGNGEYARFFGFLDLFFFFLGEKLKMLRDLILILIPDHNVERFILVASKVS